MRHVSTLNAAIFCLGLPVALSLSPWARAQEDPLVLHPGDTLSWQPAPGHNAMFGDTDNVPFAQVLKLLEFDKDFPCTGSETKCKTPTKPKYTATVRKGLDLAALGTEASFDFSCGVHDFMDTKMFTVVDGPVGAPVRNLVLITKGLAWFIKDPAGDIPIKR
ncbi:hypothetical protein [Mesorhizobium sp. STM 4661]|uniref:hypothetical protein n=1 Tax=Mesorhizobium sp. STM 4661 TaxID=1297570 RepID=UPI0002BEE9F5|nr:hypothetical protein [Mesorhizobium sp. STM 4661]CCV11598.1 exported hypothetical protein [Mesorhizobium sp. STM 4661]